MDTNNVMPLIIAAAVMFAIIGGITLFSHWYSLNRIKSKTVGDGQVPGNVGKFYAEPTVRSSSWLKLY